VQQVTVQAVLRAIRRDRSRYSEEQVNFIRESYLLDRRSFVWLQAKLAELGWPLSSSNGLYRIAVGIAYPKVPLSPRLAEAHAARQRGGAAPGAEEPEEEVSDSVRAEELLEDESDEDGWG
jgi:hypothetical protein